MSKIIDRILKREKQEQAALRRIYFVRMEGVAKWDATREAKRKSREERKGK